MENRTNQSLKRKDGKEYFILRQIVYKGDTYYVTSEIINGGEDTSGSVTVFKETIDNGKTYTTVVKDPKIIEVIYTHLD